MPDEDESDLSSKHKYKSCDSCGNILRSGQKCCGCNYAGIHVKCLDALLKSNKISDKKLWKCKRCEHLSASDSDSDDITLIDQKQLIEQMQNENSLLKRLVKELETVNALQKQRLTELEAKLHLSTNAVVSSPQERAGLYSAVLKHNARTITNKPKDVVILKPTNKTQTANVTCTELKKEINPSALSVAINRIIPKDDGSVIIKCDSSDNVKSLESDLKSKLGANYEVVIPKKVNPKIMVCDVDKDDTLNKDILAEDILKQNRLCRNNSTVFKLVRLINTKSGVNLIIECDPTLFVLVKEKKYLYVGWRRCFVKESFHVSRCYNCSRYGHLSKNCTNPTACPKCAGPHGLKDCHSSERKCVNCLYSNDKHKSQFNTNHYVFDKECNSYQRIINSIKGITHYETS